MHDPVGLMDPVGRATSAVAEATNLGFDVVIIDSAGRLHIDDELMAELSATKAATEPTDLLYVADAMTGQDAIKSAGEFNRRVGVTGVVLTKLDGDARGGAALSVVSVVGVPIAFVGSGERLEDLEPFHAERIVSRVLGMGDVLSLIERAEAAIDEHEAEQLERKIRANEFTLDDFRDQLRTLRKMGPLEQVIGMLPGMGNLKGLGGAQPDEKQIARVEAIISSMTPEERRKQHILNGGRRKRIAKGKRYIGRRGQPAVEAIRADAEDAEVARWDGRPHRRWPGGTPSCHAHAAQPRVAGPIGETDGSDSFAAGRIEEAPDFSAWSSPTRERHATAALSRFLGITTRVPDPPSSRSTRSGSSTGSSAVRSRRTPFGRS